jgi:hypothetical protein
MYEDDVLKVLRTSEFDEDKAFKTCVVSADGTKSACSLLRDDIISADFSTACPYCLHPQRHTVPLATQLSVMYLQRKHESKIKAQQARDRTLAKQLEKNMEKEWLDDQDISRESKSHYT